MSTSNSVGRLTATNEKVRLTATNEKVRLTATNEKVRLTATQENDRSAATHKKDRSRLCAFAFADSRQCRTPRRSGHQHLCYYHAKKEAEALIAKQAGEDLASLFSGRYLCPSDFAAALGRVLSAVAHGYIKPKTAVTLALLGQTLNQSIKIAHDEYANAPGGNARRQRDQAPSFLMLPAPPEPPPQVAPTPQSEHSAASEPNPQSRPQPAPPQVPNHLESILVQNVR